MLTLLADLICGEGEEGRGRCGRGSCSCSRGGRLRHRREGWCQSHIGQRSLLVVHLGEDGLGEETKVTCLVAHKGGRIIVMARMSPVHRVPARANHHDCPSTVCGHRRLSLLASTRHWRWTRRRSRPRSRDRRPSVSAVCSHAVQQLFFAGYCFPCPPRRLGRIYSNFRGRCIGIHGDPRGL
jgi:hypothetical protein